MTPREKILRDGLKDISVCREKLPHGVSVLSHEAMMARGILAKADEIKEEENQKQRNVTRTS